MKKQKEPKPAGGTAKKQKHDEIEVELVMDAYGVGRARALAILREKAQRRAQEAAKKKEDAERCRRGRFRDGPPAETKLFAEDLFG